MNNINNNNKENIINNSYKTKTILEIFNKSFNIFSKAVIQRMIPSIYDGLKTVQRRIIFSMFNRNIIKKFNKSTTVVGHVTGYYHPHGSLSVYQALTKMLQKFNNNYLLFVGQGNFGSIDGDPAAASRYTEVKLSKLSLELLNYLKYKNTYKIKKNFDESCNEPVYLPSKLPFLLLNGNCGLAVAMMSSIPPHNLSDILNCLIKMIELKIRKIKYNLSCKEIMEILKGPDFPTRGFIYNKNLLSIYTTGKGSINIFSDIEKSKDSKSLIITSIPYMSTKQNIRENLFEIIFKKKTIPLIIDMVDESEQEEVKIRLKLEHTINESEFIILKNQLYKFTKLKKNFFINLLALDKNFNPKLLNIKEYLEFFLEFRINIEKKKLFVEKNELKLKIAKTEAILKVYKFSNKIIHIIKNNLKNNIFIKLKQQFEFSKDQIEFILSLPLNKLSKKEFFSDQNHLLEFNKKLFYIKDLLNNHIKLFKIIKEDFIKIKKNFTKSRLTKICNTNNNFKDIIFDKEYLLIMTDKGYIFKQSLDEYKTQKKGKGKTILLKNINEAGKINYIVSCNIKDIIIIGNLNGQFRYQEAFKIFQNNNNINVFSFFKTNSCCLIKINNIYKYLIFITKKGYVTKIANNCKTSAVIRRGIILRKNDKLFKILPYSEDKNFLLLATKLGRILLLNINDIQLRKNGAKGYSGIKLSKQDEIITSYCCNKEDINKNYLLIIFNNGYAKKILLKFNSLLRKKNSKGQKMISKKNNKNTLKEVFILSYNKQYEIFIVTNINKMIRINLKNIKKRKNKFTLGTKITVNAIQYLTIKEIKD